MEITRNGTIYLNTQEAIDRLSISSERFEEIRKTKAIKKYRIKETDSYKRSELDALTWNDLMGPISEDEGVLFDMEVSGRW
jgi:hypothetical protein